MRTEGFERGLTSILLALAMILSTVFISMPTVSAVQWVGASIDDNVVQSNVFLVRYEMVFNKPADLGEFSMTTWWENLSPGGANRKENFTLENWRVYFTATNQDLENVVVEQAPIAKGWKVIVKTETGKGDWRDGTFYIDLWLRAASEGAPHRPVDNREILYIGSIREGADVVIISQASLYIDILQWPGGLFLRAEENALNLNRAGINPIVSYSKGSHPPIGYGKRAGSGAIVAAGLAGSLRNGRWNSGWMPAAYHRLDDLLDAIMQWEKPCAENVLWYQGYGVYWKIENEGTYDNCKDLEAALEAKGYNVVARSDEPITASLLAPYDILIIPQLRFGDKYLGGDPTQLPDADVQAIKTWVEAGHGLIVLEESDYTAWGYANYCRVQNKILDAFNLGYWFQHDEIQDNSGWGGAGYPYEIYAETDDETAIGGACVTANSWVRFLGLHSVPSLAPKPTLGVDVEVVSPPGKENAAENGNWVTFTIKVWNQGTAWDNFTLTLDNVWPATISPTSLLLNPGENGYATLSVFLPGYENHCARDYVTVTATSFWDPTVSDNDVAIAHVMVGIAFEVEQLPPTWQEEWPGRSLVYSVAVKNVGLVDDNYTVTISSALGWHVAWLSFYSWSSESIADSHVTEGDPNAVADGGTKYNMYVGHDLPSNLSQHAYLKFDISGLPDGKNIVSATLNAKVKYGPSTGWPSYIDDNMLVDVKSVSDDTWLENEITWNNAPPLGDTLDTTMIWSDAIVGLYNWYSWDVTSFVRSEYQAGDDKVSFGMMSEQAESENKDVAVWFYTKDAWYDHPYLEVIYQDPPKDVDNITISVPAGENRILLYEVNIPDLALPCTTDNLTVTVISQTNPTMVKTDVCQAHVKLLRCVEVEIHPEWQEAKKREPITYKVKVTNCGLLDDKYVLTVEDTENWGLELLPPELWIPAGQSDWAVLVVTVPEWATGSDNNIITVTASGTFSQDKPTDPENVEASDSVVAHAEVHRGVDVEIYPTQSQTGAPGYELVWMVRIYNRGNVDDYYDLSVDEFVRDNTGTYPDWGAWLEDNQIFVPHQEARITQLHVVVPDDAKTSIWNTLTVTAVSKADNTVTDSDDCDAHVRKIGPLIPQAWIKVMVEAEIIAIEVWPVEYDFGVMKDSRTKETAADYFTVRNVGNVMVDVLIRGSDAYSRPGEPVTKWTLSGTGATGVDVYAMWVLPTLQDLRKVDDLLKNDLAAGGEHKFGLKIQAPSTITVPAKMWTIVYLTAIRA